MSTDRPPPAPIRADAAETTDPGPAPRSVALAVCTYRRDAELRRLLDSVAVAAAAAADVATVGVVVVDDNPDGRARAVADAFADRFPLGVTYRHSGRRNIADARNAGIEAAVALADWVAMTDDDVVVPDDWFRQLVAAQERTGALAVTGPMASRFPAGSPAWLVEEAFATLGSLDGGDDAPAETCATNNSMVSAAWLRANAGIRFDHDLGVLGGEDMVFFRRALAAGLTAAFAPRAVVHQLEPPERATLAYQLRRALWLGNSESVTNRRLGAASRPRLVGRGGRRALRAVGGVAARARRGEPLQLRSAAAGAATGAGLVLGAAGVELAHR